MTPITRRVLLGLLGAAPAAWGADFWEKQPDYLEWSPKEVSKMLSSSPWAQKTAVRASAGGGGISTRSDGGFSGTRGGGRNAATGSATSPATVGRRTSDYGVPTARPRPVEFLVRWYSAKPIKQAIVTSRLQMEGTQNDDQMRPFIDREETHYIVTIAEFPARLGRSFLRDQDRLTGFARLERKGKAPILPERAEARDGRETIDLYFFFPRTDPIVKADKDVEFIFKASGEGDFKHEIKRKFKLADMLYGGKLEL